MSYILFGIIEDAVDSEINGKLNQAITFSIEDIGGDAAGAMVMCYK